MNFIKKYIYLTLITAPLIYNVHAMDDALTYNASNASSSSENALAEFKLADSNDEICRDLVLTTLGPTSRQTQDAVAPTMKFEFSRVLMSAFKFALMANEIYKAGEFKKAQSHDAFFKAITTRGLFKGLTNEQIIEFAGVVDKYMLEDGILASVCHTIVKMTEGATLDLSAIEVSPNLIKSLVHYYYLLYETQPVLKHIPDLRSAVRYSIRELIEHGHIDLAKEKDGYITSVKTKTDKGTIKQYKLNLAAEKIDDIDGIEEFYKYAPAESIIAIDLSNNFLSTISIEALKACTQLKTINLGQNLFSICPVLSDGIQINLLGNPCKVFGSPAVTRKTQTKNSNVHN